MDYVSTRGTAPTLSFEAVVMAGVASDGGLYVPQNLPIFSSVELESMRHLSYQELAFKIMQPFVVGALDDAVLQRLINEAYASFEHPKIAPLVPLRENEYILELFHGPTLAFKDFALQFLGRLFDYVLQRQKKHVTIIGATSGDTGSAAIEGCRHSRYVNLFILHPKGRISEVQRRQMTSVLAENVHNLAVESDFDFCQETVKHLFNDQGFLEGKSQFVAINSINWCRIMAQIIYYFYAYFALGKTARKVSFSVPTGNFGDIYAGYLAKKMGLPIEKLVIATNTNDILHRFLSQNDYSRATLTPTLSPSMDIQVSSNFERLLFDLYDQDGKVIATLMQDFANGKLSVSPGKLAKAREIFASCRVDDATICQTIRTIYEESNMVIDPHTATGVYAARHCVSGTNEIPVVTLATAHPAKFPEASQKSGVPVQSLPTHLAGLLTKEERYQAIKPDLEAIKAYVKGKL
jgi:threonine synthase